MKSIRLILLILALTFTVDFAAAQRTKVFTNPSAVSVRELDKSSTKSSMATPPTGDAVCVRELDKSSTKSGVIPLFSDQSTKRRAASTVIDTLYVVGTRGSRAYTEGSLEHTDDWIAARAAATTNLEVRVNRIDMAVTAPDGPDDDNDSQPVCYYQYELTEALVTSVRASGPAGRVSFVADLSDDLRLFVQQPGGGATGATRRGAATAPAWIVRDADGQTVAGRMFIKFDGVDGEAADNAAPESVVCYAAASSTVCLPAAPAGKPKGNVPAKYNPGKGRAATQGSPVSSAVCGDTCPAEAVTLSFQEGALTYVALDPTPIYMSINDRAAASDAEGADYNSSRSNKTHSGIALPPGGASDSTGTRAQDYNSSRSNRGESIAPPPNNHNTTRSKKTGN